MTVLLTIRDAEAPADAPLRELIGRLRRDEVLTTVDLDGLAEPDVDLLVRDRTKADGSRTFVRALHQETEGNPFLHHRDPAEPGVTWRAGHRRAAADIRHP